MNWAILSFFLPPVLGHFSFRKIFSLWPTKVELTLRLKFVTFIFPVVECHNWCCLSSPCHHPILQPWEQTSWRVCVAVGESTTCGQARPPSSPSLVLDLNHAASLLSLGLGMGDHQVHHHHGGGGPGANFLGGDPQNRGQWRGESLGVQYTHCPTEQRFQVIDSWPLLLYFKYIAI